MKKNKKVQSQQSLKSWGNDGGKKKLKEKKKFQNSRADRKFRFNLVPAKRDP